MTSSKFTALCAVGITLFALAYLAPATGGRGTEMDEGAAVAYPARVLDGAVPHRDFLTFYGPGNIWIVAAGFATVGESVATERAVGLLYRLVIVLALFLLALRIAGVGAAVIAAMVATLVMGQELIWAYATYGALAFGLLGIALTAWAVTATRRRLQLLGIAVGGFVGGAAVLIRFDYAPAVVLAALPVLSLMPLNKRWWYAGGFLGAMTLYAIHFLLVGPERVARVTSDLLATGPGRTLPIPRPWAYPGSLLSLSGLVLLLMLGVGVLMWRRRPHYDSVPQVLVAVALFDIAVVPYALFRPDLPHIRPLAVIPLSMLPALAFLLIRVGGSTNRSKRMGSAALIAVTLLAMATFGDFTPERARELREVRHAVRGFESEASREAASAVVARARSLARPGESLFVGPQDLRRTNYGPTYLYFVLRDLRPASYYMEMNPGTANREGSGLANDIRRADWLILTSEWDDWTEPNDSIKFGPSEPNEVVRDDFCLQFEMRQYQLYERCTR